MCDLSIVPERYSPGCPFPADGQVIRLQEMFAEEREDVMRFLAVELIDSFDECGVVVEDFEVADGVGSDLEGLD